MSYILDALRRADSERERGAIPSLHSKPVPAALADADDDTAGGRRSHLMWAVLAVAAVLAAAVVWLLVGRGEGQGEVVPPVPMATPAPASVAAPETPPERATAMPMPAMPVAAPQSAQTRTPARPPPAERPPVAATAKPTAPTARPPREDDDAAVPSMAALPENIRREIPSLTVSGATYSKTASSRMLILNGQVFHEGDKVAGELMLEQIRLKSAVFSYRGHRFGLSF